MKKHFKKIAMVLSLSMAVSMVAPAVQVTYAATEAYDVTLGTPTRREITEETLEVGKKIDLNFYGVKDWNQNKPNYKCKWSVSGGAVVVDNWGVVTAVKAGTAVVSLTVTDKLTGISHNIKPAIFTVVEQTVEPAVGDLTEEEIKFFNEEFFTTETKYPGRWVRNNILYTEFANPAQVDIEAMLYDENGEEEISEEEYAYLRQQVEELFDTSKLTTAYINELMQTYLGISLEESEKKGLDKFFYNAEYDAYYLMHSDALCVSVQVEKGVRNEDGTITLVYLQAGQPFTHLTKAEIEKLPRYQVVLKETENGYQFLSNQMVTQ